MKGYFSSTVSNIPTTDWFAHASIARTLARILPVIEIIVVPGGINSVGELFNPDSVIFTADSTTGNCATSPEFNQFIVPFQYSLQVVLGVPPNMVEHISESFLRSTPRGFLASIPRSKPFSRRKNDRVCPFRRESQIA